MGYLSQILTKLMQSQLCSIYNAPFSLIDYIVDHKYFMSYKIKCIAYTTVCVSGVRYRKFSYHDYWTQHIAIWYISRYTANHLACLFTLMILVPLMLYQTMVHNTTHSFNNKITVYNDILCLVTAKIYT